MKKIFFQTNKLNINLSQNSIQAAYKVLNLQPNASLEEVKSQYRTLSKKYHPDTNANSSANDPKMQSINAAYATLKKHLKNK
ncbi:MAG TPA: J domain-containing protein [Oligoflexia bacterium]|nr:J domain-containing protein [Oligoflexia bacterium]